MTDSRGENSGDRRAGRRGDGEERASGPISLEHSVPIPRPRLPGGVVMRPTADNSIDAMLADLLLHATNCVRQFGDFHLAVSAEAGMVRPIQRLMYDPPLRGFPWLRTRVWVVNEVGVGLADERCRSGVLRELIAEQSGMPMDQFHPIDGEHAEGAARYEAMLKEVLGWREKGHDRLDAVLGVLDGNAGVFGWATRESESEERLVIETVDVEGQRRVAMTPRLVNSARLICVLLPERDGEAGARAAIESREAPARLLRPVGGELRWYAHESLCRALASVDGAGADGVERG
ncbi:MAG: 6-phosphogluconolactonase [Phycisphaerales bacterium]|nr:MAG: 6-phosphogluconolactonase [Phycisphaerales bacterium]